MEESQKLNLYYFNNKFIKPLVFFIVKVFNKKEEEFLEENTNFLFNVLIENGYAESSDIVIFNIIKAYNNKIINWILPSKNSDQKILKQIESNHNIINKIIAETLKNTNCKTLVDFSENELKILNSNINLSFLAEQYY